MSYRDAETAFRERAEDLEREIVAFDAEIAGKQVELDDLTSATAALHHRLEREGPGGGEAGARLLRIPLLADTLLGIGLFALVFQLFLAFVLRADARDAVPVYLIMSAPTIIGTVVAYPFRSVLPNPYRAGLVMTWIMFVAFLFGVFGVIHA